MERKTGEQLKKSCCRLLPIQINGKRVSDMKRDGRRKRLIILLIALLLKKRERTSEKGRVMSC